MVVARVGIWWACMDELVGLGILLIVRLEGTMKLMMNMLSSGLRLRMMGVATVIPCEVWPRFLTQWVSPGKVRPFVMLNGLLMLILVIRRLGHCCSLKLGHCLSILHGRRLATRTICRLWHVVGVLLFRG